MTPSTEDILRKVIYQAEKTPDGMSNSPGEGSKRLVLFCFDGRLSSKVSSGQTEPSMSVDSMKMVLGSGLLSSSMLSLPRDG